MRGDSQSPPDARIVYNYAHGDLARKAGRFPVMVNYTTKFKRPDFALAFFTSARSASVGAGSWIRAKGGAAAPVSPVRPQRIGSRPSPKQEAAERPDALASGMQEVLRFRQAIGGHLELGLDHPPSPGVGGRIPDAAEM